jgi:hypothetical protein
LGSIEKERKKNTHTKGPMQKSGTEQSSAVSEAGYSTL